MKTIYILFILSLLISSGCNKKQEVTKFSEQVKETTEQVYICTGPAAIRYHLYKYCRGLNKCSSPIIQLSLNNAINKGYTPCKICY